MTTVEILKQARELIADSERWTRYAYARDSQGEPVMAESDNAVCWCAAGAIERSAGDRHDLEDQAQGLVARDFLALTHLNDGPVEKEAREASVIPRPAPARHQKVLAAFDRAIERVESKR